MDKYRITLNALLMGLEVTYKGIAVRLFKHSDTIPLPSGDYICDTYWLGSPMQKGEETVYVGIELDFTAFLRMCDLQTDEELLYLGSSIALTNINRKVSR